MSKPLFEQNVLPVLEDVRSTFETRGQEYADTWANCRWLALTSTLKLIGDRFVYSEEELRAIAAAVFVDTKYARLEGPYKEDTVIDLIAYAPNWLAQMRKLQKVKDQQSGDYLDETDYNG